MRKQFLFKPVTATVNAPIVIALATIVFSGASAAAEPTRSRWDQQEALRMVQKVIAQEESNSFDWNKINWLSVTAEAAALAEKEQKPILVYFFLKGTTGPAAAPC